MIMKMNLRVIARWIGIGALVLGLLVTVLAITRPPSWRAILYDEMFDACRDDSFLRARMWMFLGASPDGASDYEAAGSGRIGSEFGSHVHVVVYNKGTRLLRLLISRGANPDLQLGDGATPLSMAVHEHRVEVVKVLLEAGANPRYTDDWTAADQAGSLNFHDLVPVIEPYLEGKKTRQARFPVGP